MSEYEIAHGVPSQRISKLIAVGKKKNVIWERRIKICT